jgi:fatty-acyl-CoA synthase
VRVLEPPNPAVARILETARRQGGRPFLTLLEREAGETRLTYADLLASAGRWRERYFEAGLATGDRVVVVLEHGEPLYASYLGALLGGLVPAYFAHPSGKVDEPSYCATVNALLERVGGQFLVTSRAIAGRLAGKWQAPPGLLEDGSPLRGERPRPAGRAPLGVDALFLQFSSGTTGLKKGVAVSAQALLWQVDAYAQSIGLRDDDVIASWLPLYHDMGLIACFYLPLLRGVPLVAMSPFDWVARPEMLLDAVTRHRATLAWLPNFAYNLLAERAAPQARAADLSSLRAVVNCSEPILDSSHRRFIERLAPLGLRPEALAACYALAENTFAVASGGIGAPLATESRDGRVQVSSGRVLPGVKLRIQDPAGKALAEGEAGEIVIAAPCLFSGYVGNPEETAAALSGGWFRTGDLGYLRQGELYVVGRIKDTIIIGGRNVFPQDVEAVVGEIDGVIPGRCVAVGADDLVLGTQSLVVIAETRLTDPAARDGLRRRLHDAIAGRLDLVAEIALADHMWLRKSTSGKIARAENRDRYLQAKAGAPRPPPRGAPMGIEAEVRACILQALALGTRSPPPFSDDEDLVRAGIVDSFSLVGLRLALEDRFGRERAAGLGEGAGACRSVRQMAAALGGTTAPSPAAAPSATPSPAAAGELAPQMRDVEGQPYEWVAYLMRRGMPNYRSPTLSSDEHGFRTTVRGGKPLAYREFVAEPGSRGVVLGNSFAYGIGTTHDSRTFTSLLNRSALRWYNLSQRASVTMQERLAFELYAPDAVDAVAWVSGINNLISLIVGEGAPGNPAPFVGERQYATRMMPGARFREHAPFEERYLAMLRQLEMDISSLALRLRERARLGFFLQPSASWVDKPLAAEERTLIERFDNAGAVLQQAHHPRHLQALHARFAGELAAICGRWKVDFVDCNADARYRSARWLFIDRTHMTDAGHEVTAAVLTDWLGRGG